MPKKFVKYLSEEIGQHLLNNQGGLSRHELVKRIYESRPEEFRHYKFATFQRELRRAFMYLIDHGSPICSTGKTMTIFPTQSEKAAAVRRLTKTAVSLLRRAKRLDRIALLGELRQMSIFDGVIDVSLI